MVRSRRAARCNVLLAVAILAAATAPAYPQANVTGVIKGYVTDASGNFVPGATVTLASPALVRRRQSQVTDGEGYFRFTALPVGMFSLQADILGYSPYEIVEIQLNPGEVRVFDVVLPEGLEEKVVVAAEKHVIDLLDTGSREVIDSAYVNRLPLIARRYQQILPLFPGRAKEFGLHHSGQRLDGKLLL